MGKSYEKGTFFSTHIDEKTFDIKQIKIDYLDIEGHEVVSSISYQGNTLVTQEAVSYTHLTLPTSDLV